MKKIENVGSYKMYYSRSNFWIKIANVFKKAGEKVIYIALLLYYVLSDPDVSKADKAKIYGALGYFILPLDLIPDVIPVIGYTDDLVALVWALRTVYSNITPEIECKAKQKLFEWFDRVDSEGLDRFIRNSILK